MNFAWIPRSVAVFAVGLAIAVSASSARAQASLTDADAQARLEAMQATGALRDPFWAHAYWTRSREAPTTSARIADLKWAIRFDPELLATRWELTGLLLRDRRPDFVPTLVETLTAHATSFVGQRRFALAALTVAVGALLLSALLLAILAIAKTLPRLRHALLERLRFLPAEMRGPAATLTMAAPVALSLTLPPTAAAFWGTAFGTIAAWRFLDAWERRTCLSAMAAVLVAPVALVLWTQLALPGMPSSYLGALWETQGTADVRPGQALAQVAPPRAHGDPDWHASLALADRRAGRYAEAAQRLERAMELDPREWSYPNNLGNVLLLTGDVDGALQQYATARTLAPDQPLVRINEAQAWVKKLEFPKADEALQEAMRLGHHLPPLLGDPGEDVIVHDRVLDASAVWRRLAFGEGAAHALGISRAAGMSAGVVFPFRPFWLSLPLFLTAWWVALARYLPRVSLCATCGAPVCRKCHYRVLRRSLCATCHSIRREVKAPLKRQELLDERRGRILNIPRRLTVALAFLLPGSGYLLRGAPRRAALLMILALGIAVAAVSSVPSADRYAPAGSSGGAPTWAILTYLALAVVSLAGTLRLPEPDEGDEELPLDDPRARRA